MNVCASKTLKINAFQRIGQSINRASNRSIKRSKTRYENLKMLNHSLYLQFSELQTHPLRHIADEIVGQRQHLQVGEVREHGRMDRRDAVVVQMQVRQERQVTEVILRHDPQCVVCHVQHQQ